MYYYLKDQTDAMPPASTPDQQSAENHTEDIATFDSFVLLPALIRAVNDLGYETPSPIQTRTIPLLLNGHDVIGLAQTGTGKTAAFALPVLHHIAAQQAIPNKPLALILTPTRELALQVSEAIEQFARHMDAISVLPIYGGSSYGPQLGGLKRGAHIVVGTPGRVIDHLNKGSLDLSLTAHLVLDEADEMLKMGFAEDIEQIFSAATSRTQTALFSATMPNFIRKVSGKYLQNPAEVSVESSATTTTAIRQRYVLIQHHHKTEALSRILEVEDHDGIIVFVRTKQATEVLAEDLRAAGLAAAAINGDIPQQARERTVENLRSGQVDILVATDVAARGLDVERISLVVNFDIPHDSEAYVHRIGRTGRAGRTGDAIVFITPREQRLLKQLERATESSIEKMTLPTVEELTTVRTDKFKTRITEALHTKNLRPLRRLIAEVEAAEAIPASEIAAALATLVLDGDSLIPEELPVPQESKGGREGTKRGSAGFNKHKHGSSRQEKRGSSNGSLTTFKIKVGRNDRVQPRNIVGALTHEGGLHASDIGHIDIRQTHSLVDLPADIPEATVRKLRSTKIQGRQINLERDKGGSAPGSRKRSDGSEARNSRGKRPPNKGKKLAPQQKPAKKRY